MLMFFFNATATTEIYTYVHTLSLHDALPISSARLRRAEALAGSAKAALAPSVGIDASVSGARPTTQNGIPVTPERQGWNDYAKASLGFSWEIDFWGKNRAALKAATSEAWAAEADVAAARLMISTAIASS